ncbi:SgrR family transcriptional regulator [Kluyvera sp. CRP]|uniref:SgrR family transcriptional regulator n=1 Tax=Kluyvera sp. CRP TaxID=2873269 RepID=UPI001CC200C1|nr:SgrR family transcriptional regulator [Kluyvera sp. CRP]UAK18325.1 SgrR family transcriptional regulator [Kluyvera sp. CRP]
MIQQSNNIAPDARLLRLARQYKRLLNRYQNQRREVQLQDVADTLACSPRYARTLLKEMQQIGWISWASLPGRGKQSLIQCRHDIQHLQEGIDAPVNSSVTPLPMIPASGGYHFIFPYYRPISAIVPKLSAQHLTRHLIRMVHVGLARYLDGNTQPELALAHHVEVSTDRTCWRFYLRQGLVWHNNDPFSVADCAHTLRAFAGTEALPYVQNITADQQCIEFHLTQPDEMLLHRLANPVVAIPHPVFPTVGIGPFLIAKHTDDGISLVRFPGWYGEMPLARAITLETRLRKVKDWGVVQLETERSTERQERTETLTCSDTFSFLAFNNSSASILSRQQRITLTEIAKTLASSMMKKQSDLLPVESWLTMSGKEMDMSELPPLLSMAYFSTPDTEIFVKMFARYLLRVGCRLTTRAIHNTHWPASGAVWESMDIALGYLSSVQQAAFTFEERWRRSSMVKVFWPKESQKRVIRLLDRSVHREPERHKRLLIALQRHAIRHHLIVPLYQKQYTLRYPKSVKGIHCHPQCWPDFARIWIDDKNNTW